MHQSSDFPWQRRFSSELTLPLVLLVLATLQLLTTLSVFRIGARMRRLEESPAPTLVQMANGDALVVDARPADYRSPEVVVTLVEYWARETFEWSVQFPDGSTDAGVTFRRGADPVTTRAFNAQVVLSERLRLPFLTTLGAIVSPDVFEGEVETFLRVHYISAPRALESGAWEVDFISTLLFLQGGETALTPIPVNKTLRVRAVPPPRALPETYQSSPFRDAAYRLLSQGLEIYHVEDFEDV